jgi:pimeloyl-ACP methyl ester carboxylesterase
MSEHRSSRPTPARPEVGPERIVRANGVDLCVQGFGDRADPAILLIAGTSESMLAWAEAFCERLAAGSRFVIRYDHRDTGRSVCYPPGAPEYTGRDLVEDAIGVLDADGVASAHVVGISAGGGIAQSVAVHHPDRVATLTLLSTTSIAGTGDRDLPPPSDTVKASFTMPPPDWSDRAAVIDYVAAQYRPLTARSRPVAEEFLRDLATRTVDRAVSIASMSNHGLIDQGDSTPPERLAELTAPTLVVHGTEDPLFPYPHGTALAAAIPGARLLTLEHTGHELPPAVWDTVIAAILRHTARQR